MFIEAYDEKKLKLCEFVKRVGGHNIHTPFELTEKVVNTIEADEKAKVAVLFNIEFVFTLIALKGIDPKKITFFGDCPKKRQLVESWGCEYVDSNVLLDKKKRERYKMKFDVVVGNPPFEASHSKKLWPEFSNLAVDILKDGGYLGWVIPIGWMQSNNAQMKKVRKNLTSYMNTEIVDVTTDNYFKVSTEICSIIAQKVEYKNNTTVILKDGTKSVYDITEGFKKTSLEKFIDNINNKIINGGDKLYLTIDEDCPKEIFSVEEYSDFKYPCIYTTAQRGFTNKKLKNDGILKIGLNISSSYYNPKSPNFNMPITTTAFGGLMKYIIIDNKEEGLRWRNYLSSKPIRFLAQTYKKKNSGFCHAVKQDAIPKLDMSKIWTDEELYAHFNLTQEEIDYIEANVK